MNAVVTILSSSATCTEPGNTEYKAELSFNGNVYTDSQSVSGEALGHNWAVSEWIWSEDYTSVTAKFVCARDNSHTRVISGQINEDVIKPATCTEDGESTFTATVSLGGETYTDQKTSVVIKARHVLSEKWSADDVYHWHECTVCGEKPDLSTHELVDFICSVCNHTIIYTEGLEYTLSDDGESYLVSGIGTATDRDIKIMPTYDSKPVTGIADYAFKDKDEFLDNFIKSILIPDSVESIGKEAFYFCGGLQSVTIGNGVTSIGGDAFYNCSNITRVDYLGDITGWLNIEGLVNLMIGLSGECELYLGGTKIEGELIIPDGVTSIADHAFVNLSAITSVTIPDSVKSIGNYAFMNCSGLTSVTIPDSVTSIGSSAFQDCSSLTSVTIGNGVTSIGQLAFYNCYRLIQIYNNSSIDIIAGSSNNGYVAYYAKRVLTNEEDSKLTIDESGFIFYYDGVDNAYLMGYSGNKTAISLPETFTANDGTNVSRYSIYKYAFYNCSGLTSVTIPDSVTSIGEYAFYNCRGLTEVRIGNGVTRIGIGAFYNCSVLTSATFKNIMGWKESLYSLRYYNLARKSTAASYLSLNYASTTWERR